MNDFDDIISGAVTRRADGAPIDSPDFETVLATRQDRMRRRTALAAGGLVVAGLAGIGLFATAGNEAPGVAGEASSTTPGPFATTTAPDRFDGGGDIWFCTGRVYPSTDGSPEFTVLETLPPTTMPAPTTTLSPDENPDLATVGTVPTVPSEEDLGYYRNCSLLSAGSAPTTTVDGITEDTSPPFTTIVVAPEDPQIAEEEARAQAEMAARRAASEVEARRLAEQGVASHIVNVGDDAILIAERYCVSLEDLLHFNGWTSADEFPFPGDLVTVPPTTVTDCNTPPPTTAGG